MEKISIRLNIEDPTVSFTGFIPEGERKPAVIALPGGGYNCCAYPEGEPIARRFADMGYAAFVLNYSTRYTSFEDIGGPVNPHTVFPEPLREVACAIRYLREHADSCGIDPAAIALIGSSAGGHLAASYCNSWNLPEVYGGVAEPDALAPSACVLLYAAAELSQDEVLMSAIYGKSGPYTPEELSRYTARERVGKQTPPTVLFHSAADPMVPVGESLRLFEALQSAGIASELHVFGCGGHAYGLGEGAPEGAWPELADAFLRNVRSSPESYDREAVRRKQLGRFPR